MNHKATAVGQHNFTSKDKLFLDANIWLYLYCPQGSREYWVKIYSNVFNRILNAKSQIYIDVLVVSEFINRFARQEWELAKENWIPTVSPLNSFKNFRDSIDFEPIAQGIAAAVKQIMENCSRIESGFTTLEMANLLADYAAGHSDFNDQVITELCKSNGLTLITNDSDFKTQEIPILTANSSLLPSR